MERCLFECGGGGSINQPTVNWITLESLPHYDAHLAMLEKNNWKEYLREWLKRIYSPERIAIFLIDMEVFG